MSITKTKAEVNNTTEGNVQNATLYIAGAFGVQRICCRKISWTIGPYAQHRGAVRIKFTEPRKRLESGIVLTDDRYGIILFGLGHVDPADPMVKTGDRTIVTRYPSFDPRYKQDFDQQLARYLDQNPAVRVLADFRSK